MKLEKIFKVKDDYQLIYSLRAKEKPMTFEELKPITKKIEGTDYDNIFVLEPDTFYFVYKDSSLKEKDKFDKIGLFAIEKENKIYFLNLSTNEILIEKGIEI